MGISDPRLQNACRGVFPAQIYFLPQRTSSDAPLRLYNRLSPLRCFSTSESLRFLDKNLESFIFLLFAICVPFSRLPHFASPQPLANVRESLLLRLNQLWRLAQVNYIFLLVTLSHGLSQFANSPFRSFLP